VGTAVTSLGVALVAAGLCVPLERLVSGRGPRRRGIARDLALYAVNSVAVVLAVGLLLDMISRPLPWRGAPDALPWVARLLIVVAVGELAAYGAHRAAHALPLLWRFHRLHHDPAHALDALARDDNR